MTAACVKQGSKLRGSRVLDSICNMSFEVKSGLNLERERSKQFVSFRPRYHLTLNFILRFDNARGNDVAAGSGDFAPMRI
jgi:hypothetical protein